MYVKCHNRRSLWLALIFGMLLSATASAIPSPIARVGAASKTVVQKTFDGAKTAVKVPVHAVRYAAVGAKDVTVSLVNHVRNI